MRYIRSLLERVRDWFHLVSTNISLDNRAIRDGQHRRSEEAIILRRPNTAKQEIIEQSPPSTQEKSKKALPDFNEESPLPSNEELPTSQDEEAYILPGKDDDRLQNERWLMLVKECVHFVDDLDRKSITMDSRMQGLAEYVCAQLAEILERSGVELITDGELFDERFHHPEHATYRVVPHTNISEILSPGFLIGPLVLRRARVRLAEEID